MTDLILTGASRGIGFALARAAASSPSRLVLTARDVDRLEALEAEIRERGGSARSIPGDLGTRASAGELGHRLTEVALPGSTLVHNAAIWPSRRVLNDEGFESAFAVNFLGPLALQAPLVQAGRLARILVVSAGLIFRGRFDPERTPTGEDFSGIRTYCTTKLCFAVAMRDFARRHPEVDVLVLHPGVVRTDLGAREGALGWLLSVVKRRWEDPEDCAARLARFLERPRWSQDGQAPWFVEEVETPWPAVTNDEAMVAAILDWAARAH